MPSAVRRRAGGAIVPLAIGLLAAALRLWNIDLAPFGYDEIDVLGRARAVLNGDLTRVGPLTSWGIPDPPMSVYLMVPPSALPRPALAAAAWIALLNVVAVVLTWVVARRFFGPRVALAAGLLFAVNPWAVYFSRRTWAEIVPLFTVVALWAALEVVCRGRARWAVAFFLMLALQVQTRILAVIYAPAAVMMLAPFPRRWGVRWPLVGIAVGVLVSLPYLSYVVEHWAELASTLAAGNRGIVLVPDSARKASAPELLLWTAAGYGLLPAESRAAPWLNPLGQAGRVTLGVVGALLATGLGMATWGLLRHRAGPARWLPAVWLLLPVLALVAQSSSVYLHYMVALFPAMFVVMAFPLGALLECRRPLRWLGGGLLILICAVQIVTTGVLYRVVAAYDPTESASSPLALRQAAAALPREASDQLGTGERYGVEVPLRFWQALGDRGQAEAARVGLNEAWVLANGTDPLTEERPAILDYVLRPRLEPRFLLAESLVLPIGRPALVVEAPDVDPAESLERFGERRASFSFPSTNRAGRDLAHLTLVEARSVEAWAALAPTRLGAAFHGGVELLGFRASRTVRAGDALPVVTYWRLAAEAPASLPRVSLSLVDDRGRALASEPARRLPPPTPIGERVLIHRQEIAVPTRAPQVEYRLEASLADADGRSLGRLDQSGDGVALTAVRVTNR